MSYVGWVKIDNPVRSRNVAAGHWFHGQGKLVGRREFCIRLLKLCQTVDILTRKPGIKFRGIIAPLHQIFTVVRVPASIKNFLKFELLIIKDSILKERITRIISLNI